MLSNDTRRIAVGSARIRLAGIVSHDRLDGPGRQAASTEGIADIARHADTVGDVVDHLAVGVCAAVSPRAGVNTLLLLAGLVRGAFVVACALGPAGHVWIPEIARYALASGGCASCLADSVGAAGGWIAGIHRFWLPRWY